MKKKVSSPSPAEKIGLGLALVLLGAIFVFGSPVPVNIPNLVLSKSFESEPVEVSGFIEGVALDSEIAQRIIVPELDMDIEVNRSSIRGGYWEVFGDSAGWGDGSGVPGEVGNQVVFAHAQDGLFSNLRNVREGMRIYVLTQEDWFGYEVVEVKEVAPDQTEVIEPTEEEKLTLYTCSGFNDEKRLIVVAKPLVHE